MKKNKSSALYYLLKNFFGIAMFSVIPSLCLSFYSFDIKRADFLIAEFSGNISQDDFMLWMIDSVLIPSSDVNYLIMACGVVLSVFALSLILPKVSRHMHLGVNTNKGILRYATSIILKVAFFVAVFLILDTLFGLCSIGLMYFVNMLNLPLWRGIILLVLFVLFKVLLSYLLAMFCCTLPAIVEEGYKLNIAASYSTRIMASPSNKKFVMNFIVGYVVSRTAVLLLCIMVRVWYIRQISVFVFYLAWMSLVVPLFCSKYVMSTQGERKDISKSVFSD